MILRVIIITNKLRSTISNSLKSTSTSSQLFALSFILYLLPRSFSEDVQPLERKNDRRKLFHVSHDSLSHSDTHHTSHDPFCSIFGKISIGVPVV